MRIGLILLTLLLSKNLLANELVEQIFKEAGIEKEYEEKINSIYEAIVTKQDFSRYMEDSTLYYLVTENERKSKTVFDKYLSWEAVKPVFIEAYDQTYTTRELQAYLDFVKSDAGKSFMNKENSFSLKLSELMRVNREKYDEESRAISEAYQQALAEYGESMDQE